MFGVLRDHLEGHLKVPENVISMLLDKYYPMASFRLILASAEEKGSCLEKLLGKIVTKAYCHH